MAVAVEWVDERFHTVKPEAQDCILSRDLSYARYNLCGLEHAYMRPEVNSNRFEISLRDNISLRCEVT